MSTCTTGGQGPNAPSDSLAYTYFKEFRCNSKTEKLINKTLKRLRTLLITMFWLSEERKVVMVNLICQLDWAKGFPDSW